MVTAEFKSDALLICVHDVYGVDINTENASAATSEKPSSQWVDGCTEQSENLLKVTYHNQPPEF
jgi:hypothetical protein